MDENEQQDKRVDGSSSTGSREKKVWQRPRILSQEPLEAVAAGCDLVGPNGKSAPPICLTLGS